MVLEPFTKTQTWYVVFDKPRSEGFRPWRLLTGKKFAHCWMLTAAGEGVIRYEPLHWGVACYYDAVDLNNILVQLAEGDTTALLSVTVDYRLCHEYQMRGLYSCVSQLKALLGMRKCCFTITPFQLYKRLCKQPKTIAIKPWIPYVRM